MWLVLMGILILLGLGAIKFYLDSLTQSIDNAEISEDLVSRSFYIAKDELATGEINYNLISSSQQNTAIAQVVPDKEIKEGEKILSALKNNTNNQALTTGATSGSNTGLKTPETLLIAELYK